MATAGYLPDQAFLELFDDTDSDEEMFYGFSAEDITAGDSSDEDEGAEYIFSVDSWTEGDRVVAPINFTPQDQQGLTATAQGQLPQNPAPVDFLDLYITDLDYKMMAMETNRYAQQFLDKTVLKPSSRFRQWSHTTWQERKVFIAMIIAMGLVVQLDLSEYWTTDPVTSTPFFSSCMSRDRFWLLMSFFHLVDNRNVIKKGLPGHNPLFKLGSLYNNVIQCFWKNYRPSQQLSLDEGMIPWRGHLSFRVYNPDKPKRYGIKAYMVCDATNGYCTKFKLYTGKSNIPPSEHGITYDLVMDLMRNYFGQGYLLYVDNYYSSPRLFWDLWSLGIGATGTLRCNRKGVPQQAKDKVVAKGNTYTMHNKDLMLMKFHDRKVVYLLSTQDSSHLVPSGKTNPSTGEPVMRPQCVCTYDKFMGGVDRSDQMVSYATFNAKTLKWWKRVIFHMISLCVLNSFLLYKTAHPASNHRQFRKMVVKGLIASVNRAEVPGMSAKPRGRPSTEEPLARLQGQHFLQKIKPLGVKKNISRKCAVCGDADRVLQEAAGVKRKRGGKESSYECILCRRALCVDPCHRLYHSYRDYEKAYRDWKQEHTQ